LTTGQPTRVIPDLRRTQQDHGSTVQTGNPSTADLQVPLDRDPEAGPIIVQVSRPAPEPDRDGARLGGQQQMVKSFLEVVAHHPPLPQHQLAVPPGGHGPRKSPGWGQVGIGEGDSPVRRPEPVPGQGRRGGAEKKEDDDQDEPVHSKSFAG